MKTVSKSEFKAKALEYFREVERTKKSVIITDHGKPKLKLVPFQEQSQEEILKSLRGSVHKYENPLEPVGENDWELEH
jgi:prevent-host-death family protein